MMIDISNEREFISEELVTEIINLIKFTAQEENVPTNAEVSITFVENDEIQEINREYRGKNTPTDVISFALEELGEGEIVVNDPDMPKVLGDIIISVPMAQEQAKEYNHSFEREIGFLAVHGFLHLLGYDHMDEKEEREMFTRQKELLDAYGLER